MSYLMDISLLFVLGGLGALLLLGVVGCEPDKQETMAYVTVLCALGIACTLLVFGR